MEQCGVTTAHASLHRLQKPKEIPGAHVGAGWASSASGKSRTDQSLFMPWRTSILEKKKEKGVEISAGGPLVQDNEVLS